MKKSHKDFVRQILKNTGRPGGRLIFDAKKEKDEGQKDFAKWRDI